MRVSAHVEYCPTCHQPLPDYQELEDRPSGLIVWIVVAMLIAAGIVVCLIVL